MKSCSILQILWLSTLLFATNDAKMRVDIPSWGDNRLTTMVNSRIYKDCLACLSTAEYLDCPNCLALYKVTVEAPLESKRGAEQDNAVNPLPCVCASGNGVQTDLGNKYFPRYVPLAKCDAFTCSSCKPPTQCHQIKYSVAFLVKRLPGDRVDDADLPGSLRSEWKFEWLDLPVGCNCTA